MYRKDKKKIFFGLIIGVFLTVVVVLASGFMIETTNTDTFCITCHAMKPFGMSWDESIHGGENPQGFAAQCVDCHLPHGGFIEYVATKAVTGIGDVFQNMIINPKEFDWKKNAEEKRAKFTYDNACRRCHRKLVPRGISSGGLIAHRSYLRKDIQKKCVDCHPHVGHKNMIETANIFFKK